MREETGKMEGGKKTNTTRACRRGLITSRSATASSGPLVLILHNDTPPGRLVQPYAARGPRSRRRRRAKQLAGVGASRDTGLASGQAAKHAQWRGVLGDHGSDCTGKWHSRKLCVGGPAAVTAA